MPDRRQDRGSFRSAIRRSIWVLKHPISHPPHHPRSPRRHSAAIPPSSSSDRNRFPTLSLDTLPVELQIRIVASCDLHDINALRLVSRALLGVVSENQHAIARDYLRRRRGGSLPVPTTETATTATTTTIETVGTTGTAGTAGTGETAETTETTPDARRPRRRTTGGGASAEDGRCTDNRSNADSAAAAPAVCCKPNAREWQLLSDLFPPEKRRYGDGYEFSLQYLWRLRHKGLMCSRLAFRLADRLLEERAEHDPGFRDLFASRRERRRASSHGVAVLYQAFTVPMICILFYLETCADRRRRLRDSLFGILYTGRLPPPPEPLDEAHLFRRWQESLLQNPPFTHTETLIFTHHVFKLLVSYLWLPSSWISMLCIASGFGRFLEFFEAEKGGPNANTLRRNFMHNMQLDWDLYNRERAGATVYGTIEEWLKAPPLNEIWFDVAAAEMARRGVRPHLPGRPVEICPGAKLVIGCQDCNATTGHAWQ